MYETGPPTSLAIKPWTWLNSRALPDFADAKMPMSRVIDTNVPLVTKFEDGHPIELVDACAELIEDILMTKSPVVTDADGEIVSEYFNQLSWSGQPSLGDAFAKYVHEYRFSWSEDMRPDIQPIAENSYSVLDGDDSDFDPSDRKFVAAAKVSQAPVYEATDTKWLDWTDALARHGVEVVWVHEESIRASYAAKFGRPPP